VILLAPAAFAATVAVQSGPESAAAFAPRRVAVVIGVQDYDDPALRGLRFSNKDATDLGNVLGSPDLGGFDRVTVIEGAAATSRVALRRALAAATADLQRDDTFLLYLSGHGTLTLDPIEGSRLWFLPSDARLEAPAETGLAVSELEDLVNSLPARRRVLILDTCHNGRTGSKSSLSGVTARQLQGLRGGEPPAPRGEHEVEESEARLYAAQYYQPAMEDAELQNGVYTHYLIEGLTGARADADLDGDGLVGVTEAHAYARDHTIAYTGGIQVPRAEYRIVGREEIYLSGKASERSAAEQALVSACDMVLNRARLLVNGVPRGEFPGLYAVDPGPQTLEVRTSDGRTVVKERVRLQAGSTTPIEDLVHRHDPAVDVLAGASVQAGTDLFHTTHAALEVAWVRPFPVSAPLRPDLHVGLEYAEGPLPSGEDAASGAVAAGATLGFDLGPAWVGPAVDLRVPVRRNAATGELQSAVTGAGLVSFGAGVPVGRKIALELRADASIEAQPTLSGIEPVYGGALRAGLRFRP
jgi:uncharacterized caspase-like protein